MQNQSMIKDGQPAYKVVVENGVEKVVYIKSFDRWMELYNLPTGNAVTLGVFATKEEAEANCGTMLAQVLEAFDKIFSVNTTEREVSQCPRLWHPYGKQ